MDALKYWVAFNLIPGIGRAKFALLDSRLGGMENAWKASAGDLKAAGLDERSVEAIISHRPAISPDAEMEKIERLNIVPYTCNDPRYPSRLKEIYDYPPVLYVRGSLNKEDEWSIAVVGTRRPSIYGRQVAEELTADLARNRICIVSGLARGIDSIAHRAALQAGGRTVAIFACGLDIVYPAENARLAKEIMENGALVSEYHPGVKPRPEHFPRRNRIMSGLSLGVLVVEANEQSGALITAHLALEQNREVFAVPGSILSPTSRGTNNLIQEGAKLVSNYTDVLEELNLSMAAEQLEMKEMLPADEKEEALLKYLTPEPKYIDEICRESRLPVAEVSGSLAMMELKGMVKQVGAMHFAVVRRNTRK
ncbi:MAG: DNA-processing protein DprA [Dehalococcoidia bacterium]|nr:DNA-processing protein DprA [Dehalococcoidia bacterium]MDZ4245746.1 DNA-processing protein DprA [Dehalococcoidia bacterium]